jgi:ABC-type Fe3+ transport system substrate-binding protein
MHPAKMAKTAGSQSPDGAALYLLPEFFARSGPHHATTRIVWPEEGAYLTPQYLLRKHDARPAATLVLDYLCGAEWAAHLAKIGFAPARAGSPPLPGRLRWVGWDFVRANDLDALRTVLNAAFVRGHSS